MKKISFLILTFIVFHRAFGQIDMNDSTAQVVGYWDKNEKQSYILTHEKYKITEEDTTDRVFSSYIVDIEIIDSTEDSYTIKWFYHNHEVKTDNVIIKKLAAVEDNITVIIKTDELGVFKEFVNWQEIRDKIIQVADNLKTELQETPNIDLIIDKLKNMYSTKESIESGVISEIQQFYTFHGGKYKLGEEINTSMKMLNILGGDPFDADVIIWMDELNPEDNDFVMRMQQTVNSEQYTKANYDYLAQVSEIMNVPATNPEDFPKIQNNIWTASRIHTSGWILYSVETKEVSSEGSLSVEENILELQQ